MNSFFERTVNAWNKLDVTHAENIDIFKTKLGESLKELSIKF